MFVAADDYATEGLPVELAIKLPTNGAAPIEARGRIAWINNKNQPKQLLRIDDGASISTKLHRCRATIQIDVINEGWMNH